MVRRRLRVAVLIDSHRTSLRAVLRGIAAYGRDHGPWSLYHQDGPLGLGIVERLHTWRGDGVLYRFEDPSLNQEIRRLHLPAVNLRRVFDTDEVVQIEHHHQAVARQAAEHLIERGFGQFAYCGFEGKAYSERRGEAFAAELKRRGLRVSQFTKVHWEFRSSLGPDIRKSEEALAQWLVRLEKPVGLMACNDLCAQKVLMACSELGLAVPEDVAVVGVDDDDLFCDLCDPPLSSVDPNFETIGYEAAAALARIIRGEPSPACPRRVEPLGVVLRASTDVRAIPDREVAAALHYIRQHACEGILVEDVYRAVRLSRSTLERRFAKLVGRSPRAEILRRQLERVQQLLASTDFPLKTIAQIAGFAYPEAMCHMFKRVTGQSPGQYRQAAQSERPA